MRPDPEVEAIGMEVALRYEREAGWTPEDVSRENLGYDIRSVSPEGAVRYIEVKARAATGPVALTPNEWVMAQRLGEDYWLYIVEHAATARCSTGYKTRRPSLRPKRWWTWCATWSTTGRRRRRAANPMAPEEGNRSNDSGASPRTNRTGRSLDP